MKKCVLALAAGAAVLLGGVIAVPGSSAQGLTTSQCSTLFNAAESQGEQGAGFSFTPKQLQQVNKAFMNRFAGQLSATGCPP